MIWLAPYPAGFVIVFLWLALGASWGPRMGGVPAPLVWIFFEPPYAVYRLVGAGQ